MSERSLKVRVTGQVQGVGYRAFTATEASQRGIRGWVRNEADGSVEAALHGAGAPLAELIGLLRSGPPAALVETLDVHSIESAAVENAPAGAHRF